MSEFSIRAAENYLTQNSVPHVMYSGFIAHPVIALESWKHLVPGTLSEFCKYEMESCQHPNATGHIKIADALIHSVRERLKHK